MDYRRTSFLAESAPSVYRFLSGLKPYAAMYAGVLGVAVLLSLFFQWGVLKFFIDCMMGWTILAVAFVGVVIVALDKEILLPEPVRGEPTADKPTAYKYSMIWGIFLILAGIATLFLSNQYKRYYAFQCQSFYVESNSHRYHINRDCQYLGDSHDCYDYEDGFNGYDDDYEDYYDYSYYDSYRISKVKGKKLSDQYELCNACREWAEDAEGEYAASRYYRH